MNGERDIGIGTGGRPDTRRALSDFESELRARLRRARVRLLARGAAETLLWGLLWIAVVAMAASLARPAVNDLPSDALSLGWRRWLLWACAAIGLLFLLSDRIVLPLIRLGGLGTFSRRIDRSLGAEHMIVAAAEALRRPGRWRASGDVAQALVDRTIRGALQRLRRDPPASVRRPGARLDRLTGLVPLLLLIVGAAVDEAHIRRGWNRLAHPPDAFTPSIGLYAAPAPEALRAGSPLVLDAVDFGTPRGPVVCRVRGAFGPWEDIVAQEIDTHASGPFRRFRAEIPAVDEPVHCRFVRDGILTPEFRVDVYHPPRMTGMSAVLRPPAYTGLPDERLPRLPSVLEAPAGSGLDLAGRVNHPLRRAGFTNAAGDTLDLACRGDSVRGRLPIEVSDTWTPVLVDGRGLCNEAPVTMRIHAIADRDPSVELLRRDHGGLFPPDGVIRLDARAVDDYGISGLRLQLAVSEDLSTEAESDWTSHDLPERAGTVRFEDPALGGFEVDVRDPWRSSGETSMELDVQAGEIALMPGEALLLRLEAADNREPGPAGIGRSRVLRLMMPAAADILTEQLAGQESRLETLSELKRKAEDLSLDLERINRELKKFEDPDFARRMEAAEAVSRQAALQEALTRMADSLRREIDSAASRGMMSGEMVERMERIGELMESLDSTELESLRNQVQSAVETLTPAQIAEAVRKVAENQQMYLDRMDRTIALLEQMKREQEMAAAETMTEDLMRRQQALADPDRDAAARPGEQEDLADSTDELKAFLEDLAEDLDAGEPDPADRTAEGEPTGADPARAPETVMREAIESALEKMNERDPAASMRQAADRMKESSDATAEQHEAMRQLAALYHVLRQGHMNMQMTMQQAMIESLRRLTYELLELSHIQEDLAEDIPVDARGVSTVDLARRQQRVMRSVGVLRARLQEVTSMTSLLSFKLVRDLDRIEDVLRETVRNLREHRGVRAGSGARDALARINLMVMNLLTSVQASGGGSGGMSMPSAGERLQQMAQTQAGLNGLTRMLQQRMAGREGERSAAREQAERLGGEELGEEQRRLSEELYDLDRSSREANERLLGDLRRMAEDAETVARQISDGDISEETLRRQERILGRMIDARNSARKRDYERRRKSRTAGGVFGRQTGDEAAAGDRDGIRASPRRAWRPEEVPGEYRDLVQRYYDYLRRLESGAGPDRTTGERP